jgi:CheY-like chemotaxis protein
MGAPMTKILYVEDNDDNICFEVIVAKNGEEGLAKVRSEDPAVILMDLDLPVLDGWEATRRLKASDETRHIPVIAVSAYAMISDRKRAFDAGCDDFFSKPVDLFCPKARSRSE